MTKLEIDQHKWGKHLTILDSCCWGISFIWSQCNSNIWRLWKKIITTQPLSGWRSCWFQPQPAKVNWLYPQIRARISDLHWLGWWLFDMDYIWKKHYRVNICAYNALAIFSCSYPSLWMISMSICPIWCIYICMLMYV